MAIRRPVDQKSAQTIAALNDLLRGELAAVETYNQALAMLDDTEAWRDLRECQNSHQDRVLRLRAELLARGADPAESSGAWGLFANLVARAATAVSPGVAVSALDAGEDHGLKEYLQVLPTLDKLARSIVSADLYRRQIRTRNIVAALKHSLVEPSAA